MTQKEFEERTGLKIKAGDYSEIEEMYMNTELDKDKFCELWVNDPTLLKEIERYTEHKAVLEKSCIQYGGGLIFRYNSHKNDVELKEEIFGADFFKNYMAALDNKIETLKKEFEEL